MARQSKRGVKPNNNLFIPLNPDCIALIFAYLSPIDVAQCERVCKVWRDRVRDWIVTFGIRQHWPTMSREGALQARLSVLKEYKRFAQQYSSFKFGRASCARHFAKKIYHFSTAANFAVWAPVKEEWSTVAHEFWWQDLSFQLNGRLRPLVELHLLPSLSRNHQISHLYVNPAGLMYVRIFYGDNFGMGVGSQRIVTLRELVYEIRTRRTLWHRDREVQDWPIYPSQFPGCIGKDRVYIAGHETGSKDLAAYELQTGKLVFQTAVPDSCYHYPFQPFQSMRSKEPTYQLHTLQSKDRELLVRVNRSQRPDRLDNPTLTVEVIDGTNGHVLQTMQYPEYDSASFAPMPATLGSPRPAFALVAIPKGTSRVRVIEKFELRLDVGLFTNTGQDAVVLPPCDPRYLCVIEPASLLMASVNQKGPLCTWALADCPSSEARDELEATLEDVSSLPTTIGTWFRPVGGHPISLPPEGEGNGNQRRDSNLKLHWSRRLYLPDPPIRTYHWNSSDLQIVDGGRLLYRDRYLKHSSRGEMPEKIVVPYVIDFMPRGG